MNVPLLDLKAQYATIKAEVDEAVARLFESQYFILGDAVSQFEQSVAQYCNTPYAVGVSSGTDALLISLMSAGVGPGDEVITSPYTFFATGGSIARTGARPVFTDIDPVSFNMDVNGIEALITDRTKAIIPVHLYGQCVDMDTVMAIANRHDLVVIEDAAQAIGAEWNGRRAGSMGHYGCFSFFPSKNLGGAGDGGMVTMQDETRYKSVKRLRNHGMEPQYTHHEIGGNFRLDALQAAVLEVKLKHLDQWTEARQHNADTYRKLFTEQGLDQIERPREQGGRHIYNQFVIRIPKQRDDVRAFLIDHNIGSAIYYPIPLHLQPCFKYMGYQSGDLPVSETAAEETLALPVFPELTAEQLSYVVQSISKFYCK